MLANLEPLAPRLGGIREMVQLPNPPEVNHATIKAQIINARGQRVAVVLCASDRSPTMIARGVAIARETRALLGSALGSVILEPLATGELHGRSYVVLPFCRGLRRSHFPWKFQRRWLVPYVLRWLHAAAEIPTSPSVTDFHTPLRHIHDHPQLPAETRSLALAALARLDSRAWTPRHTLDHNDLWKNNILLPPAHRLGSKPVYPFTVIDWVGANPRGYGVYDLLRFCKSMKLPPQRISQELDLHCAALGSERPDAPGHLLASLGRLSIHIEDFPVERYVALVASCLRTLREADAARAA